MLINKVKVEDEFTLPSGTRVRVTAIHEENNERISIQLVRISGNLKGTMCSNTYYKANGGKIDLVDCHDFTPC